MSFGERLKDAIERSRIVARWRARLETAGITHVAFCKKHKFDTGQFSRWINQKNSPEWTSIEIVEKALAKEGV